MTKQTPQTGPDCQTTGLIQQFCATCNRIVAALLTYTYRDYYQISDRSQCPDCDTILWDWEMGKLMPPMVRSPLPIKREQLRLF